MKKFLYSIFCLMFLVSCIKNEVETNSEVEDNSLEGEWILNHVACFCGFEQDYDFSSSTITFDTVENEITVENNGEFQFLRESGTYGYSGKGNTLLFDNGNSYIFEVEGTNLRLTFEDNTNIADDEVTYSYNR